MEMAQLLGNFGEFFGAIAIVGTLAYLAVQVGHRSTRTPGLLRSASIFVRGNENPSDLDDVDRKIFGDRMGPYFNAHLMFHRMVDDGFLEPEFLDFVDKDLRDNWGSTDGARTVWQEYMELYPNQDHINSLLREAVSQG